MSKRRKFELGILDESDKPIRFWLDWSDHPTGERVVLWAGRGDDRRALLRIDEGANSAFLVANSPGEIGLPEDSLGRLLVR